MPPTFAALHAPSPEAMPSTLPLTSSVAAALRSRGNRRASDRHAPPLGAFLPPIRDAPCLHGGVLPPTAPSPEAVPSSLLWPHRHLAALHPRATHMIPSPRTCGRRLFSLWAARQCRRVPWARLHPRSFRPKRGRPPPVRVAGVMCVLHPSQGSQGGSASTTPTHRRWGLSSHPFGMPLACTGVFCRAHAPSPEAVPSSLLWPHRHLAALHPRATHMIPSPRTCGRRLFSLWAARQCRRVPWARLHPRSFRPKRGRPPPVRVAGVMCVLHPSQGSQGGSASTTPTHRRWGLSSHPFGMPLACTGVFCRAHAPSPEAVPSTLPLTSVASRGTTQPRLTTEPATATHRRWGLSSHPFGVFHLHPVVLRSDGTEKSTAVGYHRITWLLIVN